MKQDIDITCDICEDLMPLVMDHVASEDSKRAVQMHWKQCEYCREKYSGLDTSEKAIDDDKVLSNLKRKIYSMGILTVVLGLLLGIVLVDSNGVFYNFIIMPFVGGIGYLLLKQRWYYGTIGIMVIVYLYGLVQGFLEMNYEGESLGVYFQYPLFYTIIFGILTVVGVVIAALLTYGLKGEGK